MTYWKNQHFKALQSAWYERLKDIGFTDLEKLVGDEMELIHEAPSRKKRVIDKIANQTEQYYTVLTEKVSRFRFKNYVDEFIMRSHSEGKRIKIICKELECHGMSRCRVTVRITIRRYEMLWGIRKYSPKQLNKKTA